MREFEEAFAVDTSAEDARAARKSQLAKASRSGYAPPETNAFPFAPSLDVDDGARRWLAEKGYDKDMGARPMARLIQEQIKKPLAEKLLFGELADRGGQVRITAGDDGLVLTVDASEAEATC